MKKNDFVLFLFLPNINYCMTKKVLAIFFVTVIVFCLFTLPLTTISASTPKGFTVVLDAGHGGIDNGAIGRVTGAKEAEINLGVCLYLRDYFENAGINVVLTRQTPMGLYGVLSKGFKIRDLKKRVEIAKNANADVFISVHMNTYSSSQKSGSQVYYNPDNGGRRLAECLQAELDKIDTDNRAVGALCGDYYLLNNLDLPCVIAECGFLSSPTDEALLITPEYQKKLAYSLFVGTYAYLYGLHK